MPTAIFKDMKRFVGFDGQDADNVRSLIGPLAPLLPGIVDRFYGKVRSRDGVRDALDQSQGRTELLRQVVSEWLHGLFSGIYDDDYIRERARAGRDHLRAGLPQHLMIVGIQCIWQELEEAIRSSSVRTKRAKLASLHKLLILETGIMLESYRESHAAQVRQVEHDAMEARLREAEQLAQIGQLAASLAHEIKNPLAGISGAIEVIRDNLRPDQPHWPVLGEVLRQIKRLDRTVKDLLVYARPKPPRYQRCELSRVVERVVALLRQEPEFERVRFEYGHPQDLVWIAADEHLLEQLLMNLLLNAAHASPEDGLVRVSTSVNSKYVRLVVEDRGCGMDDDVTRRALEPFFTTKARGTGLGLPICRKIAEAHGGTILIRSTPGEGTDVTVELLRHPNGVATGAEDEYPSSDR